MQFRKNIQHMTGYVPGEQPRGEKVIKLNTNENPYPCSPKVRAAVGRAVQQGLHKYPDPLATTFRIRAGDVLGIAPEWILCGNGSDDLLTIITRTFVGEGDVVRFAYPGYILYRTLAELQGATCQEVHFEPDWTLGDPFTEPHERLRLVYLANPNSPSGSMLPPQRVAEIARKLDCPLVVDEAYVDFAESNCLDLVVSHENVIVTRSLSKSYALAGLRFGFAVAQPQVIEQLIKVKDSYNCDALAIAGATAAIDDQAWLAENRGQIVRTRERLAAALRELDFEVTPSHANFAWATHATRHLLPVYEALKREGVLVRYLDYPNWGDGLRISVGSDPQIDALLTLLRDIIRH
jgi:histidinol-phosphate aminotransferase